MAGISGCKSIWCCILALGLATDWLQAGVTVHTADFVDDAVRTNFNSFESLPATYPPVPPGGVPALLVEDNIRVEQVPRQDGWITSMWWWTGTMSNPEPPDGERSWYPAGGDYGYTRITRQDKLDFQNVGFFRSSGQPGYSTLGAGIVLFELLDGGELVLAGSVPQSHDIPLYLGFSGGGFDEVRVRDGEVGVVAGFYDGTPNALALDAIELSIPEPATVALLAVGLQWTLRKRLLVGKH